MKDQPESPIEFMQEWLATNEKSLKEYLEQKIINKPEGILTTSESEYSEEEADEYNEEDEIRTIVNKTEYKNMRTSVSAEVYGDHNKKENFVPPVIQKSDEIKTFIKSKLQGSFIFNGIEEKDLDAIVLAMKAFPVTKDTIVITQGEKGDHLYFVYKGNLKCYREINNSKENISSYQEGTVFGELALLYNAPRAASIVADTDCQLFELDRETFNHIVKEAIVQKRKLFNNYLDKVEILNTLTSIEKEKISDCLMIANFDKGDCIIKEGEIGNIFYFLMEGKCSAFKKVADKNKQTKVFEYKEHEYFGELSLLKDEPRAASIIADTPVKLAYIDRASFKRLLGSLEELLKRSSEKYNKFVN